MPTPKKKRVSRSTREKISASLKRYYRRKALEERRKHRKRSELSKKGWKTRRYNLAKKRKRTKKQKPLPALVSVTLFDGHAEDPPIEHFWSNIRFLAGHSISNKLARIPAEEGFLSVVFRLTDSESFGRSLEAEEEGEAVEADTFGEGEELQDEWETDTDPDAFWSTYFDHAREFLPKNLEGKSDGNKSLLVVTLVLTYAPGQISTD